MIKQILIALVLIIGLSGIGNAATNILTTTAYVDGESGASGDGIEDIKYMNNTDNLVGNITVQGSYYYKAFKRYWGETTSQSIYIKDINDEVLLYEDWRESSPQDPPGIIAFGTDSLTRSLTSDMYVHVRVYIRDSYENPPSFGYVKAYAIFTSDPIYHISGVTACLSNVSLYYNNSGAWTYMLSDNLTTDDYYKFNVSTDTEFKLIFDDDHEYIFSVTENTIYDYNGCIQTHYRFEESCGNLIPDSEGFYIEKVGSSVHAANNFYVSSGILTISQSPANNIYVSANPFSGEIGWFLDPIVNDTTYTLENPNIAWGLKVIVQNESDGELIDGAMVKVDQDCYCTSGYSTRQKLTVNGMSQFSDMSLQDASLFVMKTGYKMLDENTTGYSTFLSGRSNFSSKTWIVKLAPSSSNNSSTFYEIANKVDIHFRDVNGNITSKILDTDAHVDLYYQNNNTEEEAMTLRFESSSTHTYFMPERTYTIPHDESGYKRITNGYFTPWDYSYRAVIYNSSIYGWNITIPLTVRNGTREEEQHYQNLTTNLWFLYASDGKVDYRDDLKVAVHAQSNNTTLMAVDVELWIDGVYSGCKNLTAADFTGAEVPYYYVWSPSYNYVTGSNYSIRMYGFDRTILETDYVMCVTDNTTRKNKLTIIVKNHYGTNLDNAFVYLEDYGSLPIGTNYYNSYEGLDNGYYRFKAAKSGYTGTGWDDITLSGSDGIVTYVLTASDTDEGGATQPQKMDDTTLRNLYIPLMALLLILILFGGLKSVL